MPILLWDQRSEEFSGQAFTLGRRRLFCVSARSTGQALVSTEHEQMAA